MSPVPDIIIEIEPHRRTLCKHILLINLLCDFNIIQNIENNLVLKRFCQLEKHEKGCHNVVVDL